MQNYLDLLADIMINGVDRGDRTGTGTRSVFGRQLRFDMRHGLPVITTKKIHLHSVIHELLWFIQGGTNTKYLNDNGVTIWDEWADLDGNLGPVYGKQWRSWPKGRGSLHPGIDQLAKVIKTLRTDPDSRRMIVSAWNVAELDQMALEPCHLLFQLYSRPLTIPEKHTEYVNRSSTGDPVPIHLKESELDNLLVEENIPLRALSLQMYQRSADVFLGVPFNITSYAILLEMIAHVTNHIPDEYVHTLGDVHIYHNHAEQVQEQLSRTPRSLPVLDIVGTHTNIAEMTAEHLQVLDYDPLPGIKAPIAV